MIQGLFHIFVLLWAGEALVVLFNLPLPGNVLGMVFMALSLSRGWIKLEAVEQVAQVLLKNMAFFFVPPGVGLMLYFDLLGREWLPLGLAFLLSSFAVLLVVGLLQQWLERRDG